MNYAEARKREDGSGWHFTVRNDDRIWPHECCRTPGPPATEEEQQRFGFKPGELTLGEAHAPHATREEAEECFHQWRMRQPIQYVEGLFGDWSGCQAPAELTERDEATVEYLRSGNGPRCDAPTKGGARVRDIGGPDFFTLCQEHRQDEIVRELQGRTTSSMYS
jgi:hypothetical protein